MAWRIRAGDQPIRLGDSGLPAALDGARSEAPRRRTAPTSRRARSSSSACPRLDLPTPRLIDTYIAREYLRVFVLGVLGLLAIFYISTFIDMMDKLFRGETTTAGPAPLLRVRDAAVHLLRRPDVGAGVGARHGGRDDEEQRAAGAARLRHQPVPRRWRRSSFSRCWPARRCSCCRIACSPRPIAKPIGSKRRFAAGTSRRRP